LRQKKNRRKSIVTIPDFEHHRMPHWRFEQFSKCVPVIWEDKSKQETDEWLRFISALDEFNERRKTVVTASAKKVADESMAALRPRTTKRGGLPHLSFIMRKPEPFGTEFKNTCCGRTGVMMALEVQRSKKNTPSLMYNKLLGVTTGVCLRLLEHSDPKDGVKECIKGDAWFGSVRAAASLGKKG
jgi:hypothetical protein